MTLAGGLARWGELERVAARIAPLGWHVDVQLDGRTLPEVLPLLSSLPARVVIDHTGKFLTPVAPDAPAFRAAASARPRPRLGEAVRAVRDVALGAPGYDDVARLAAVLARDHSARCVWGSNWPHPNASPVPDDLRLLGWLDDCTADDAVSRAILVDNPTVLYGF